LSSQNSCNPYFCCRLIKIFIYRICSPFLLMSSNGLLIKWSQDVESGCISHTPILHSIINCNTGMHGQFDHILHHYSV
jgi:hypothetical protein